MRLRCSKNNGFHACMCSISGRFFVYFIVFYSIVVQNLIYFFCLVSLQNKEDEIEIERNERRCFVDAKIIWNRFKCIFKTTKLIHCSFLHSNYIYIECSENLFVFFFGKASEWHFSAFESAPVIKHKILANV